MAQIGSCRGVGLLTIQIPEILIIIYRARGYIICLGDRMCSKRPQYIQNYHYRINR
jgi:hypothetical protein